MQKQERGEREYKFPLSFFVSLQLEGYFLRNFRNEVTNI